MGGFINARKDNTTVYIYIYISGWMKCVNVGSFVCKGNKCLFEKFRLDLFTIAYCCVRVTAIVVEAHK